MNEQKQIVLANIILAFQHLLPIQHTPHRVWHVKSEQLYFHQIRQILLPPKFSAIHAVLLLSPDFSLT